MVELGNLLRILVQGMFLSIGPCALYSMFLGHLCSERCQGPVTEAVESRENWALSRRGPHRAGTSWGIPDCGMGIRPLPGPTCP